MTHREIAEAAWRVLEIKREDNMPDITMCSGRKLVDGKEEICKNKDNCYRHTATPNTYRQSYFMGAPFKRIDDEWFCRHYWRE